MRFDLVLADLSRVPYAKGAKYRFKDGHLVIDDGEGLRRTYSPNAWDRIEEDTPRSAYSKGPVITALSD